MLGSVAPRMPSVGGHGFARNPSVSIQRSQFDRSHSIKTTFDADYLIPILCDEVIPGDTINCRLTAFARLNTPIKPIMDNMYLETFFFFVPNRLLWNNWEKFCGAQTDPGDSIAFTVPTVPMAAGGPEVGSLWDYFGIPTDMTNGFNINALHSRAYNRVWNEWFRSEDLQDSVTVDLDDGADTQADYVLLKRGKRHDYFTSCLPWPQKGTAVSLPLGGSADVEYSAGAGKEQIIRKTADGVIVPNETLVVDNPTAYLRTVGSGQPTVFADPHGILYADLSTATSVTINDLREAIQTQAFLEACARGGTRYPEIIRTMFGVVSPDFRLQRSEYLGGGSSMINIHPVPQTSPTSGANPQGGLAAFGTVAFQGHGFSKSFTEHGVILGLVNVRADITYSQGLDRMWFRQTRYEYPWPAFYHLGEQEVYNKEIFNDLADGTAANQREGVFGYIPRYDDFRFKRSLVTGVFRPAYATPLDSWHLSEEFAAQPTLDDTFIQSNTPVDRVVATPAEPHFMFDGFFKYIHARPLPVFAVPGLGDRL